MKKGGIFGKLYNMKLKRQKKKFLRKLSLSNINDYYNLPNELKYDREIILKLITVDKSKVKEIPKNYLIIMLRENPNLINKFWELDEIKNIAKSNPELLKYAEQEKKEEIAQEYFEDTIDDALNCVLRNSDTAEFEKIISDKNLDLHYKISLLKILTKELNKEENEHIDVSEKEDKNINEAEKSDEENIDEAKKSEENVVDEAEKYALKSKSEIFYSVFMNVYSQLPKNDKNAKIAMIEIWREAGKWKNNLEQENEDCWKKVRVDFYNIISQSANNHIDLRMKLLETYMDDFDEEQLAEYLNRLFDDVNFNSSEQ